MSADPKALHDLLCIANREVGLEPADLIRFAEQHPDGQLILDATPDDLRASAEYGEFAAVVGLEMPGGGSE